MYETRIAADHLTVAARPGIAPELDVLAARNLAGHGFLRAAWFAADADADARTLVLTGTGGAPLAAIPTVAFGPALLGARKVPGAYWPLRAPLVAPACTAFDLAAALGHPAARSALGAVSRIGPVPTRDPGVTLLAEAAQLAGWSVLARPAGTSWVVDLEKARRDGWPRRSTAKRLARIERRLASLGTVGWRHVRGDDWNEAVLDELAAIEAASWIATRTDGRGAKFMTPQRRAYWRAVLADRVLAGMLCATLLTVDGRAVAFSFDCDDGPVRYGIAGSYMTAFARHEVGKLANYRALADAMAEGRGTLDLGVGDSGYKAEMGAVPGDDLADLLLVRSPAAARLIARAWGEAWPAPCPAALIRHEAAHG